MQYLFGISRKQVQGPDSRFKIQDSRCLASLFPCTLNLAPCTVPLLFPFETLKGFLELKLNFFTDPWGPASVPPLGIVYPAPRTTALRRHEADTPVGLAGFLPHPDVCPEDPSHTGQGPSGSSRLTQTRLDKSIEERCRSLHPGLQLRVGLRACKKSQVGKLDKLDEPPIKGGP
jgi:hypothetical protein